MVQLRQSLGRGSGQLPAARGPLQAGPPPSFGPPGPLAAGYSNPRYTDGYPTEQTIAYGTEAGAGRGEERGHWGLAGSTEGATKASWT